MTNDSETLGLIGDAARSFARHWGGSKRVRARLDQPPLHDRKEWDSVIAQGWLGMMVPEEKGGLGLSARALIVLLQEMGSGLVMSPVLPGIATAALLADLGTPRAGAVLADVLAGETYCLASLPWDDESPELFSDDMSDGPIRGWLHDSQGADGIVLFDLAAEQVSLQHANNLTHVTIRATIDGGSVSMITASGRDVEDLVASGPAVSKAMNLGRDIVAIGSAAMLLGCARRALDMALDYLNTRRQFGVPIGSFQALQHRAASLHVALASSQSFLTEASACFDSPNRTAACAAARARAADCALQVVKEAVQFHGAIGFADEHDVGLYFRRVVALASWHGNSSRWRREYFRSASCSMEYGHR